jgi:hypothetical protein
VERTLTDSAPTADQRKVLAGHPPGWLLFALLAGSGIGVLISLLLYSTSPAYVALLPLGGALLLPTLFLENLGSYWLALFLLSLQFTASKNLNDGRTVIESLNIDYTIHHFTFEITATDLALLMLCIIWVNDRLFHKRPLVFPNVGWFIVGYLGLALLSIIGARSSYLGLVEISRQFKFFIVFLFAVNCLDSKSVVRVLAIVCMITLVVQAGTTVLRVETGYYTPIVIFPRTLTRSNIT